MTDNQRTRDRLASGVLVLALPLVALVLFSVATSSWGLAAAATFLLVGWAVIAIRLATPADDSVIDLREADRRPMPSAEPRRSPSARR